MLSALRGLWAAYERQLASKPIPTQMATSCVLWCIGDFLAQRVEHYEESTYGPGTNSTAQPKNQQAQAELQQPLSVQHMHGQQEQWQHQAAVASLQHHQPHPQQLAGGGSGSDFMLDRRRLLLTSAFGAGFIGPVGHVWYEGIEKVCRRLVPSGGPRFLATKVVLDSAIMGSIYVIAFFAFIATALERTGMQGFLQKMQVDFVPTYIAELAVWPVVQTINFSQVPVRHQLLVVNSFSLLDAAFISWVGNQSDWYGKILQRLGVSQESKEE